MADNVRVAMLLGCLAAIVPAQEPVTTAEVLAEVTVPGERRLEPDRPRQRGPLLTVYDTDIIRIELALGVRFQLQLVAPQREVRFRRTSTARKLATASMRPGLVLHADRLATQDKIWISSVTIGLDAAVDEADGLPAVMPFGPRAALVNLDYLRMVDAQRLTRFDLYNAMHPQTRDCIAEFGLGDDGAEHANRFILLGNTLRDCLRVSRARDGDLLFAPTVPEAARHALQDLYRPIAARFNHQLGSEPGLILVAWWPESPHQGFRLEPSWNRTSVLLLHGAEWRDGITAERARALGHELLREQVHRRLRQADRPGDFTASSASYLIQLAEAQDEFSTRRVLARQLPGWIGECDAARDCGQLVQFVYDAAARHRTDGGETTMHTWQRLLRASDRRGESGVDPEDFIASSPEASRIVGAVLGDGPPAWDQFVAGMRGLGVEMKINRQGAGLQVEVVLPQQFED